MNAIAILIEHDHQSIAYASLASLTAAEQLGLPITVFIAGHQINHLIAKLQTYAAIDKVIYCDDPCYQILLPEDYCQWVQDELASFSHILMGSSSFGKATLPRVAAQLNHEQFSDVTAFLGPNTLIRQQYAGNIDTTIELGPTPHCFSIRPSAFTTEPKTTSSPQASTDIITAKPSWQKTKSISQTHAQHSGPTLANADIVLGGGRGLGTPEAFQQLQELAQNWGAAIGASRAAVDAGLMANEYQIGQTGQIIAPKLYIAIGISGAIQHVAGILDSQVIVAINNDPDAPIFNVADYKLVMDWQQALPLLEDALKQRGLLSTSCIT